MDLRLGGVVDKMMRMRGLEVVRRVQRLEDERVGLWWGVRLQEDLEDIARPGLCVDHKLILTTRMSRVYECLATIPALT